MKRNTFDSKSLAALPKFIGPVLGLNFTQPGKEWASVGEQTQHGGDLLAEPDARRFDFSAFRVLELLTLGADRPFAPVHIFGGEIGNIRLRPIQMPAQFVKRPTLRVLFAFTDPMVFVSRNRTLGFESDLGPTRLGNHRLEQPVHRQSKIMNPTEIDRKSVV